MLSDSEILWCVVLFALLLFLVMCPRNGTPHSAPDNGVANGVANGTLALSGRDPAGRGEINHDCTLRPGTDCHHSTGAKGICEFDANDNPVCVL